MLKITMTKTPAEERWILHGRLIGPWVRELQAVWRNTHRADERQHCVFDLNDVTLVDKSGEKLLMALAQEGVQFEASGIYVPDVVEQLKSNESTCSCACLEHYFQARLLWRIALLRARTLQPQIQRNVSASQSIRAICPGAADLISGTKKKRHRVRKTRKHAKQASSIGLSKSLC